MEPEGSLAHSQKPATCSLTSLTWARSIQSIPLPSCFLQTPFDATLPLPYSLPTALSPSCFHTKTSIQFLLPHVGHITRSCHSPAFNHSNITWWLQIWHLLSPSSSSSSPLSSSSSPLCRVFKLLFLRQTMSLGNTVLQLFCCYYSWCLYR